MPPSERKTSSPIVKRRQKPDRTPPCIQLHLCNIMPSPLDPSHYKPLCSPSSSTDTSMLPLFRVVNTANTALNLFPILICNTAPPQKNSSPSGRDLEHSFTFTGTVCPLRSRLKMQVHAMRIFRSSGTFHLPSPLSNTPSRFQDSKLLKPSVFVKKRGVLRLKVLTKMMKNSWKNQLQRKVEMDSYDARSRMRKGI
ncbi:unnamed protein product [Vicia faba]|uniref:Uncharacterized protein n=1 Tax=Vicia faba TaxID=3906 RepID=A0AAV0YGJ4_VICFA|nr:unnamed protein product [Vicia faba]